MSYGSWHIQGCEDCGVGVLTRAINGTSVLCKECRTARKSEYQRNHRRACFHKADMYVLIIHDPIPVDDGGFRCGASISLESLKVGLRFHNFREGTEFEIRGIKKMLCFVDGEQRLVDE